MLPKTSLLSMFVWFSFFKGPDHLAMICGLPQTPTGTIKGPWRAKEEITEEVLLQSTTPGDLALREEGARNNRQADYYY